MYVSHVGTHCRPALGHLKDDRQLQYLTLMAGLDRTDHDVADFSERNAVINKKRDNTHVTILQCCLKRGRDTGPYNECARTTQRIYYTSGGMSTPGSTVIKPLESCRCIPHCNVPTDYQKRSHWSSGGSIIPYPHPLPVILYWMLYVSSPLTR